MAGPCRKKGKRAYWNPLRDRPPARYEWGLAIPRDLLYYPVSDPGSYIRHVYIGPANPRGQTQVPQHRQSVAAGPVRPESWPTAHA